MFIKDKNGRNVRVEFIESFTLSIPDVYSFDGVSPKIYNVTMASGAKHEILPEEFGKCRKTLMPDTTG